MENTVVPVKLFPYTAEVNLRPQPAEQSLDCLAAGSPGFWGGLHFLNLSNWTNAVTESENLYLNLQ